MADHNGSSTSSFDASPPNHLGPQVPSGGLDGSNSHDPEKSGRANSGRDMDNIDHDDVPTEEVPDEKKPAPAADEDDEEEDMDALIEELESADGNADDEEEEAVDPSGARPVPQELLNTDTRMGLSEQEVATRRKKYGLNQMKEEKENLVLKFLGYFVGPIQFVMEVSHGFTVVGACARNIFALTVMNSY